MAGKRKTARTHARRSAVLFVRTKLRKDGYKIPPGKMVDLATMAEQVYDLPSSKDGPYSSPKNRIVYVAAKLRGVDPPWIPGNSNVAVEQNKISAFYKSYEWRAARYDVLKKNDGRCELCGVNKHDGAALNVDHIKPLRHNWNLRTDPNNLQILCGPCNHGKGNRDETDWREPRLATLMGEAVK